MLRNPQKLRKIGYVLVGFAILGMLFSLLGISSVWLFRPRITKNVSSLLNLTLDTLVTTQSATEVLTGSVDLAKDDLVIIQSSLVSLEESMDSIADSLETSGNLIGDDLNLTFTEVQVALSSAATSAKFIDDTLAFIDSIPLLGADYQPETPLHISLGQVADDLEDVPETLASLETSLNSASVSLRKFSEDLTALSDSLESTLDDLDEAQVILADYDGILTNAVQRIEQVESQIKLYSIITAMFLSGMLLWLGIAQFNDLLQALGYIHYEEKIVSLSDLNQE